MNFNFVNFFKSFAFVNGILKTIAILSCVAFSWYFDNILAGLSAGLTIIIISPSNIPGNQKHQLGGVIVAIFFVIISSISINYTKDSIYLLLPTIFILIFIFAYISLYGTRASMVAIAGIFSVAITFARPKYGIDIFYNAFYILLGGLWYIFLVRVLMWIKPRQYSEQLLAKCMDLTAQFFKIRAELITNRERFSNKKKLLNLQTSLNEQYEKLRDILLDSQSKSGKTNYLQRQFLIFIELVDIFELALATPIPYKKLDFYYENNPVFFEKYANFFIELSVILTKNAKYIGERKKESYNVSVKDLFENWKDFNAEFIKIKQQNLSIEEFGLLEKMYLYLEKQTQNIENIQQIFNNYYTSESGFREEKTFRRFVSVQNYSPKRLLDHWTIKSPFFRHALRLSIVSIIGFCIGYIFNIQNAYWILFTIYIIMRPSYGLTLSRSKDRAKGTLIGAAIAIITVYICQHLLHLEHYQIIYAIIIIICMPMGYGLLQENFSLSAIFITLYIVLIYALYVNDALGVILYRILDTLIGVGLSIAANYLLFPSWEYKKHNLLIINSLKANLDYINEVIKRYNKQKIDTDYKVSRKRAFLELANLNAGLQRMLQEPKSQQRNFSIINTIVVLQQDFLSSVAAIGVQLSDNPKIIPDDIFKKAFNEIQNKLQNCINLLENNPKKIEIDDSIFDELKQKSLSIYPKEETSENTENQLNTDYIREFIFYSEQFHYLKEISDNLEQSIIKLTNKTE
ncbi:MAG: FUSC family membrane protein [Capnocytophaga sp.]|nr:FUSC family membrane protein [Capnocytophaga sp.]